VLDRGFERRLVERGRTIRVRLVRKLADYLDGIDLSAYNEGDLLDLPRREAELLIAEGWAIAWSESSNALH